MCEIKDEMNIPGKTFIATDSNPYSSREIYDVICHVLKKHVPQWLCAKALI